MNSYEAMPQYNYRPRMQNTYIRFQGPRPRYQYSQSRYNRTQPLSQPSMFQPSSRVNVSSCSYYLGQCVDRNRCPAKVTVCHNCQKLVTTPAGIFTFNQRCFNVMLLRLNNVEFWLQLKVEATLKLLRCFNVIYERLNNVAFWLQVKVETRLKLLRCFNVIFQRLNNVEFWLQVKVEATLQL